MLINKYEVFPNQITVGDAFIKSLLDKGYPIVLSLPQAGKTGCFIYGVKLILDHCKVKGITNFRIYHALHLSDCQARDQIIADYHAAFGEGYDIYQPNQLLSNDDKIINVIHHPDFKNIDFAAEHIFWLGDEVHIALNEGGLLDEFEKKIKKRGTNFWQGGCSATPFAQNIIYKMLGNKYIPIILEPAAPYYGIPDYWKDGRLQQGNHLFDVDGSVSDWSKEVAFPIWMKSYTNNGVGYIPIRMRISALQKEALIEYFVNQGIEIDCIEFNSKKSNLKKLEMEFKSKPKKLTFLFVKGSLRAAKRIDKTYIRGAWDTFKNTDGAASFQSLMGRLSGNDVKNRDFTIFCDIKEVESYIQWWNAERSKITGGVVIPSSRYNTSNVKTTTTSVRVSFHSTHQSASARAIVLGVSAEIAGYGLKASMQNSNKQDIASSILNSSKPSGRSIIYQIDAPSPNYASSFQQLKNKFGNEIIGQYVLFEDAAPTITTVISAPSTSNLKENCILN